MPHPGNEHRSSRVSFPTHCTLSIQIGPVPRPNEEPVVAEAASVKFSILVQNGDTYSGIIERKIKKGVNSSCDQFLSCDQSCE